VFLFNAVGYYGLYLRLRYQNNIEFKKKLDAEEYSGSETVIIKMPYALPYQVNFDGYERADGEFECEGEFYKIVKHKLVNDTLFVVLIKDKGEANLQQSFVDFVQASSDVPLSKSTLKLIEHFSKDFISNLTYLQSASIGWSSESIFGSLKQEVMLLYLPLFFPPPDLTLFIA
jgi:hypothetical protein